MRIAIVGGTGGLGEGLSLRWARFGHDIIIGSREAEKAKNAAEEYKRILSGFGIDWISGLENSEAVKWADVVVISVPYKHVESTIETIKPFLKDQIIISVVVPMEKKGKFFEYTPPKDGSTAMQIKNLLPGMKVVAAFQNVSAKKLSIFEKKLDDMDVFVCGNDEGAIQMVCELVKDIPGLAPKIAGPIETSASIEAITPLLINVAMMSGEKELGIKCV